MSNNGFAIIYLAITPFLVSCIPSDQVRSDEIVLSVRAVVTDNVVNLTAYMGNRLSSSVVLDVTIDKKDELYVRNKASSEKNDLLKDDGGSTYSGAISQNIGDEVELVFNKVSTGEVLSSKINIPFFYRSLKASSESFFRSNEAIIDIDWKVDSLDGVTAPSDAYVNSHVLSCVDKLDAQIDVSNVRRASALGTLNREGILEQTLAVPSDQIAYVVDEDIQGAIQYCDYEISLSSNWYVDWDGSQPPTGVLGPVWISPDTNFGNGNIPGDDPTFGITVNATPASVRVMY